MTSRSEESRSGRLRVGIDAGALYVKVALLDGQQQLVASGCRPHRGEVLDVTSALVQELLAGRTAAAVGLVGIHAPALAEALELVPCDGVHAMILAVRAEHPQVRQIIDIGGGSLSAVQLGEDGQFVGFRTNTLCAAGTGSFLDEQAERLGIDYARLDDLPFVARPPSVAARCAVFAKSDLIHRQQEGHGKPEMWSGLCRGLSHTIVTTLFRGRSPVGPLAVVGGVAQNREVMRWLGEELQVELVVPSQPQEATARGAALAAPLLAGEPRWSRLRDAAARPGAGAGSEATHATRRPPLLLQRSTYPSFAVLEEYRDEAGNEVRVSAWPADGLLTGWLGIDIGSTSTKAVLIGEREEVLVDVYRRTAGDPLAATRALLAALAALVERRGGRLVVRGVGTTGSGRKLVGAVVGADRVINEITAHVTAAMAIDPRIDTIFEIGGQDAKYIHALQGKLHNSNMNYVCAAGTGSFVEEVSRKLGFDVAALGDLLIGVAPPVTSDRCTVFMEQDAQQLLRQGFSAREVLAAVVYSVVQNYLSKVVGNRHRSRERVFFQGATARNKALVAAFENLLGVEVVVSPYCHVMGAWGVAQLTRRQMLAAGETTRFIGLDFARRQVRLSQETCTLCANRCAITSAEVEGRAEHPSWGYLCGREPDEQRARPNHELELLKLRDRVLRRAAQEVQPPPAAPVIGMPRALLTHSYFPLWRTFLAALGYRLELSPPTSRAIVELASDWVGADYCFPVKLAHGHARWLLENGDAPVLVPYMVHAGEARERVSQSFFCPYNIGLPAMIGSAMVLRGLDPEPRLLTPTLDLRWDDRTAAERLHQDLGRTLGRSRAEVAAAWRRAITVQRRSEAELKEQGQRALAELLAGGRPAVVLLGRPYNVHDPGANLALPEKIARLGLTVVPLELLPLDEQELGSGFDNMYWNYGRKILEAARFVARTPNLYAVYFSNFSCGPDSFGQTYAEEIMGAKPMLMLELDEHGADAGYRTRLEAFADVLRGHEPVAVPRYELEVVPAGRAALAGRTLWIPPMHEASTTLAAAALTASGLDARPLPGEDMAAFLAGRVATRGGECVPCPATLGAFLAAVERSGSDPRQHALFMPTAEGPCRFGQYCTLDRIALTRLGFHGVPIVSWNSRDSYDGLDLKSRRRLWTAIVLGDVLFKLRCRTVPYEREPGAGEALFSRWTSRLARALAKGEKLEPLVRQARDEFAAVPRLERTRPLVGVVGEIYVRLNRFCNQDVVRRIERAGGEAWVAPISEWILYTASMEAWQAGQRSGNVLERLGALLKNRFFVRDEQAWMRLVSPLLDDRQEPSIDSTLAKGERFVPLDFEGETILTLGRAIEFIEQGAALVVNCAPFGCMPGAMTAGVLQRIEAEHGVPVASMFYDGERSGVNDRLDTYLANLAARGPAAAQSRARQSRG